MTRDELRSKWTRRLHEYEAVSAYVSGEAICREILGDISRLKLAEEVCTLSEASLRSGYSKDHLARMVREGKLTNYGRFRSPRLRVADLPKKQRRLENGSSKGYDIEQDIKSLRKPLLRTLQ